MQRRFRAGFALLAGLLALAPVPCAAKNAADCAVLDSDRQRLRCYDEISKPGSEAPDRNSYLVRAWKLGSAQHARVGVIEEHRPTYFLLWRKTNDPNRVPSSPTSGPPAGAPLDLDDAEAKMQFSFKTEALTRTPIDFAPINDLGFSSVRLWAAYSQQSSWQWFNRRNSRPFRETSYEPELIATFDRHVGSSGLKLVNVGFAHQSNGRDEPGSRSWNRVYVQGGWEWPTYGVSLLARGWVRADPDRNDDNPDILKYLGRGDLVARWESQENCAADFDKKNCHRVWALLRPHPGRGFLQIDWATAWRLGVARFHVQVSSGYGESLIDYNHSQTTYGFGFSVGDW